MPAGAVRPGGHPDGWRHITRVEQAGVLFAVVLHSDPDPAGLPRELRASFTG
ncbi:hypothetical protein [Dactylosporangium maewongense]|uniref:hypothetical protein n=1 Tax=Dactylosporangium TaxID=35753 RepID=UPI0031DA475F